MFGEPKMAKERRFLAVAMTLVISVCAVRPSLAMPPLSCGDRGHAVCCCRMRIEQQTSGEQSCCQKKTAATKVCRCRQDQPEPTNIPTRNNSRPSRDWASEAATVVEVQITDSALGLRRCESPFGFISDSPPRWQSVACTWLL